MIQEIINAAYSYGLGRRTFSFVLVMHTILGETKRFYFHDAKVSEWRISVWESDWFNANPKKMTIVSKSGLRLEYIEGMRLLVVNPNRVGFSRTKRESMTYSQSICNQDIAFMRV